jgi:hypothetical protein
MRFADRHGPMRPLRITAAVSARVIVISDTTGPMLIPAPHLMPSAPRSTDADSYQTLTVPMTISNAIVIPAGASEETQTL